MQPAPLLLTPRFNGVKANGKSQANRFNGFPPPFSRYTTAWPISAF